MQRFKSPDQAQRFLAHAMIYGHFRPRRHLMTAHAYRRARAKALRDAPEDVSPVFPRRLTRSEHHSPRCTAHREELLRG